MMNIVSKKQMNNLFLCLEVCLLWILTLLLCLFMRYLYVSVCIYVHMTQGSIKDQEKALGSIELEL